MKNYVFIIPSICNIGGAQLYLVEKLHYLQEKGWHVDVIYARRDVLLIKELEKYIDNCFPILDYSIMYNRQGTVRKYAKVIADLISKEQYEEIVIESCTVSISTWGEIVARELSCKHICFAFEELFEMSRSQLEFAYFKHQRHELAGIRPQSVPLMFKDSKYIIDNPEHYIACSMSSIGEAENPYGDSLDKYDVVLGSFGRLDKGFVWDALLQMHEYFTKHEGKKYAVLLIGDTKDTKFKNKIYALFENLADVFITGEVCPAPLSLVKQVDVFVSSAGAATATATHGIPTIAISPETFKPNGILDYTTKYNIMAPKPSDKSTSELIEDIIDNQYCHAHSPMGIFKDYYKNKHDNNWREFDRQMKIAQDYRAPKEYYDVFKISLEGKRKWAGYYCKIFGFTIFAKSIAIAKKLFGTLIKG